VPSGALKNKQIRACISYKGHATLQSSSRVQSYGSVKTGPSAKEPSAPQWWWLHRGALALSPPYPSLCVSCPLSSSAGASWNEITRQRVHEPPAAAVCGHPTREPRDPKSNQGQENETCCSLARVPHDPGTSGSSSHKPRGGRCRCTAAHQVTAAAPPNHATTRLEARHTTTAPSAPGQSTRRSPLTSHMIAQVAGLYMQTLLAAAGRSGSAWQHPQSRPRRVLPTKTPPQQID